MKYKFKDSLLKNVSIVFKDKNGRVYAMDKIETKKIRKLIQGNINIYSGFADNVKVKVFELVLGENDFYDFLDDTPIEVQLNTLESIPLKIELPQK